MLVGQSQGKITYIETVKLDIQIDGMDESMLEMLPKSQSFKKELLFDEDEHIYRDLKGEEAENINLSSDDGGVQIKIMSDDTENILYVNRSENTQVNQKGFMGKSFVIDEPISKHKWKITGEKIKYLDYECQKAVLEDEGEFVVVWFTSQIPMAIGPSGYSGLPGAVLMVSINDGEQEIKAENIELQPIDQDDIRKPKKGKKVTQEEFERIVEEKEREIKERFGDGSVKFIRG